MSGGNYVPATPLETEQANIAQQQWQDYNKRWLPVMQFYRDRTEGNLPARKEFAEGRADADVQRQYGNAAMGLESSLASSGSGPGSGKYLGALTDLAGSKGTELGLSRASADDAVQRQYEAGLSDIIAMGRGQQATSDQALASLADLSGQQAAASAQVAAQNAAGLGEAIGTGLGIGGGYGLQSAMPKQANIDPATGLPIPAGGYKSGGYSPLPPSQ